MPNEDGSTLGERMQGTMYELWANIALRVLEGRRTLEEAKELFNDLKVDWNFVEHYIKEHKHEFPDYKE